MIKPICFTSEPGYFWRISPRDSWTPGHWSGVTSQARGTPFVNTSNHQFLAGHLKLFAGQVDIIRHSFPFNGDFMVINGDFMVIQW